MKSRPSTLSDVCRIALATVLLFHVAPAQGAGAPNSSSFRSRMEKLFDVRVPSRYFAYFSDLPADLTKGYAELSDAFVDEVNANFFPVENRFPLTAVVLKDRDAFHAFLGREVGVTSPPGFGIYLSAVNAFISYHGAGIGTFTHEIMHPLVDESLPARLPWAAEGIPAFVEKFFAHVERGRVQFIWGFQNPWRIRELGSRLTTLDLRTIIYRSTSTSEKRLISMFLFEQGKWKEFLSRIKQNNRQQFRTFVEAAMGKRFDDLEVLWRDYLDKVASQRESISQIPNSALFRTEREMREYMSRYGLR